MTWSKFLYNIISKPSDVETDKSFEIEVKLENNDNEDIDIDIWSYIYRGSKSYSGDREENKQSFVLNSGEYKIVELKNKIQEASPGDYKLKIKIRKDNQKTTKDITETIEVIKNEEFEEQEESKNQEKTRGFIPNQNPLIVYESNSYKAKRLVPFFIMGLLCFFSIILIWRR